MSAQAIRLSQFSESIAVNIHTSYTDSKYVNTQSVISDLSYLGISTVRDANPNPASQGQNSYNVLANAGIKFDLIVSGSRPLDQAFASLDTFARAHPGTVTAVEGPNEVNNWPFSYNGLSGAAGYIAFEKALYVGVQNDTALTHVPVYRITGTYDVLSDFDYASLHPYPKNGAQPLPTLVAEWSAEQLHTGVTPIVITEAGYPTFPSGSGVDNATQASLTLNLLFDAARIGASKTFLYELLDAYPDPNGTLGGNHYGLFDYGGAPKPAAVAIHNLTTILADPGPSAASFNPGTLNYSVANLSASGSTLLLQKSNGAFELAIWNEPQIWNPATKSPIVPAGETVAVSLGGAFANVNIYDPTVSAAPISTLHNVSQVSLTLTGHPLIIEVGSASGAMASVGGPLAGGLGDDTIVGGAGPDTITDPGGSNYLRGGDGDDQLTGGTGFDDINGNVGNDTASGGAGGDWVVGGKDNDLLFGDDGADVVYGNLGNDTLNGGEGADLIRGGQGNDVIAGGAGDDWLSGDLGNDTLSGGAGADTFHTFANSGVDLVTDFNRAEGDRVVVDAGATFTVSQVGSDVVIDMGGGSKMILAGVAMSSLSDGWIVVA